jgi:hypothetical protein
MRRREITSDDKEIPGEIEVRAQMKIGRIYTYQMVMIIGQYLIWMKPPLHML